MEEEAENFVARCNKCQRYANNLYRPVELLHSVISPCPFMKWGMDIVGLLPQAKGKIKRITSAPYHPVANRQVESTNKTTTGETPFSLMYGTEALIQMEIAKPSTRYIHTSKATNDEELRVNLDLTEERRESTLIRMASQKHMIERHYNRKANLRYFKIGGFVLKKVFWSTKEANAGKLSPNWEGPYRVRGIAGKGVYELETMGDKVLPSHWNAVHLKKYYF
nr:uncharacterized protein LOC117281441 [Nicotiana tomentosiformis]